MPSSITIETSKGLARRLEKYNLRTFSLANGNVHENLADQNAYETLQKVRTTSSVSIFLFARMPSHPYVHDQNMHNIGYYAGTADVGSDIKTFRLRENIILRSPPKQESPKKRRRAPGKPTTPKAHVGTKRQRVVGRMRGPGRATSAF